MKYKCQDRSVIIETDGLTCVGLSERKSALVYSPQPIRLTRQICHSTKKKNISERSKFSWECRVMRLVSDQRYLHANSAAS